MRSIIIYKFIRKKIISVPNDLADHDHGLFRMIQNI